MAKLQKGELIVSNKAKGFVLNAIDLISLLQKKIDTSMLPAAQPFNVGEIQQSLMAARAPTPSINFGDVIVYGADDKAVEEIRRIKRDQANEVLGFLNIRK